MNNVSLFCDEESSTFLELLELLGVTHQSAWPDRFGRALLQTIRENESPRPKTLSLFSGAGGLDIGFHDAGFDIVSMVEIEQKFVNSLIANSLKDGYLEGSTPSCIDIRKFSPPDDLQVDFIIGGPPCQTFSAAGRRAAGVKGTTDQRGTLFEEYVRLLGVLQPKGFLFENVYGITGAENGDAWRGITAAFADAGYRIEFRVLDSADFGVPQHRERMFIVGVRDQIFKFPRPTHGPDSPLQLPFYTAGDAVREVVASRDERKIGLGGRYGHLLAEIPPGLNYSFFTEEMGHPEPIFAWRSKFSDFLYKADPARPVRTIKAQGGQYTGPFHWEGRPFSVSELKRLQTFPDEYLIVGNRQVAVHQIGNSVPPQIARVLALAIRQQVFGDTQFPALPVLESEEILGFRKRKRLQNSQYREIAAKALSKRSPSEVKERIFPKSLTTYFNFENGFTLVETTRNVAQFKVRYALSKSQWRIDVDDLQEPSVDEVDSSRFIINVEPTTFGELIPGIQKVSLHGSTLSGALFTAVWKAFERLLIEAGIKADLVQLCGYYQYAPKFRPNFKIDGLTHDWRWSALQEVCRGTATQQIYKSTEMASLLNIKVHQLSEFASWLRVLGYEVRNHKTNSQIARGSYLIPYAFPTLSASSVQLRKSLS